MRCGEQRRSPKALGVVLESKAFGEKRDTDHILLWFKLCYKMFESVS